MLIVRSVTITLILLFLDFSSVFSQPNSVTGRSARQLRCSEPVGKIINDADRLLPAGSSLCKGDRLQQRNGAKIDVLCYLNPGAGVLHLGSGIISDKCVPPPTQVQAQQCTPQNRANCRKRKGPSEDRNAPTLLNPYSSAVLNTRPYLSWYAVAGATSYSVLVRGKGVDWEKQVSSTALPYPKEQPAMQYGNVYKVSIIANKADSPITDSSSVLIVSPASEAQQIITTIKKIKSLNLPPDELAFDLDIVYRSENLLTETINTLKARIEAGSQSPTLYRLLGDRYLDAGLPDSARQKYTLAAALAKQSDDSDEIAKAQAGLKRAELYSQLPTRMNAPQ